MTRTALAAVAAALVVGGGVIGWVVFREKPDAAGPQSKADFAADIAALRATLAEQSASIARLESSPQGAADLSRLRAAVDEQAARIARLEAGPASQGATGDPAAGAKKVLDDLKAITDGGQTIAVQDSLAALVRVGDPAVPDIVATLESGLERDYGGRFEMQGNAVASYPGLRMVLMDALRQIGTPSAKEGLVKALGKSDRLTDFEVVELYWRFWRTEADTTDPVLVAAFSSTASSMLRKIAAAGLEATADTPDSAVLTVLSWIMAHPSEGDVPALEQLVLRGRPKTGWAAREFDAPFRTLIQLAPERAAQATRTLHFRVFDTVELSGYLSYISRASAVRYYEALFALGDLDASARGDLYGRMTNPDERIKDPAQRAADMQPIVQFLESRVAAETDARAKSGAEQALARLREAIAQAQK